VSRELGLSILVEGMTLDNLQNYITLKLRPDNHDNLVALVDELGLSYSSDLNKTDEQSSK